MLLQQTILWFKVAVVLLLKNPNLYNLILTKILRGEYHHLYLPNENLTFKFGNFSADPGELAEQNSNLV